VNKAQELSDLLEAKKRIGYKFMLLLDSDNLLHSLADKRLTIPLKKNAVMRDKGFWLGSTKQYVYDYYGSDPNDPEEMSDGEYEILLGYEYNMSDVITGDPDAPEAIQDQGVEFAVSKAKLVHAVNITKRKKLF
tara:strand:+ start:2392 stop:2793 length:402 start_codon:yes stop_codon:yes gene_type:complete